MIMNLPIRVARRLTAICAAVVLSHPKKVQCNICGWTGHRFLSDSWHKHINCPRCHSGIRHRLFFAALQNIESLSFANLICNKRILHFAPEKVIGSNISHLASYYATADFLRSDCTFRIDMADMPEVKNDSFDIVMAFDVLEHVHDYCKAIVEVHRVLSRSGFGVFTVPQKDNLAVTYEDNSIVADKDRLKHFGQQDHLRIFGEDFARRVADKGFAVNSVDESSFSDEKRNKHVLFPPLLSTHPLATNYRKVFFCQKI